MILVDNWKAILLKSYSMWATIIGILVLGGSEALYAAYQVETDPYIKGWLGLGLLIAGGVGRLIKQVKVSGPSDPDAESVHGMTRLVILGLILAVLLTLVFAVWPPSRSDASPASSEDFIEVAVPFVGKWEGLRLQAYRDIVGIPTVCYGETKGVQMGDSYTKAECDAMFARELLAYRRGLHAYFTEDTLEYRLPVTRDLAYSSLAYNVGIRAAGRSTATRRLNAGDVTGGCEALTWWNKAGGRIVRGLVRRRSEEHSLCLVAA